MNILLDRLPESYECSDGKICMLNTDYRIGIQLFLVQHDSELTQKEKAEEMIYLLFGEDTTNYPHDPQDCQNCLQWYLGGWYTDNKTEEEDKKKITDFDVDQWRIVAGFRQQYGIDLPRVDMHFWEFMGLLSNLQECAYTRVIDIRSRKFEPKMDKKTRKALAKAKKTYELKEELTFEERQEQESVFAILDGLDVDNDEKNRIEEFESYADEEGEE